MCVHTCTRKSVNAATTLFGPLIWEEDRVFGNNLRLKIVYGEEWNCMFDFSLIYLLINDH